MTFIELSIPAWTNTSGVAEPGTVWTDPDVDPALKAFCKARMIEIPTPRWTACDAMKFVGTHPVSGSGVMRRFGFKVRFL